MAGSALGSYVAENVEVASMSMVTIEPITSATAEWNLQYVVDVVSCISASYVVHAGSKRLKAN